MTYSSLTTQFTARAIYNRDGEVLLLRKGSIWTFPGGKFKAPEHSLAAAKREGEEEVGLIGHEPRYLHYVEQTTGKKRITKTFRLYVAFGSYSGEPLNVEPHNHDEFKWVRAALVEKTVREKISPQASRYLQELAVPKPA